MELQQDGPVFLFQSKFQPLRGKATRPHRFRVCHFLHRCDNRFLRGLDPEGARDWMLPQPLRDIGTEHVDLAVSSE